MAFATVTGLVSKSQMVGAGHDGGNDPNQYDDSNRSADTAVSVRDWRKRRRLTYEHPETASEFTTPLAGC